MYSFDAPYDLEPTAFPESLRNYEETIDSHKNFTSSDIEDEEDEFRPLDLAFEEAELSRNFPTSGFRPFHERDRGGGEHMSSSPVLGATLSQRKKLLKERIEELIEDIHKRERLEGQMLEKAEIESTGLEFLLGQVRTWSLGNYPSVDMRRTNLEREILALKKAGWDERLRCWRDLVMLKKELREALEEYHLILSAEGL